MRYVSGFDTVKQKVGKSLLGVSALALAAVSAGPAMAQEADGDNAQAIPDIIVTAQKREQSLQSTPVSVTAIGAEALTARSANNIASIASYAPNLEINSGKGDGGSTNAAVFIRGVGQNDFIFPTDPGVGIYVDGVYIARSIGAMMDLSDIERIEVLRGPQGTLYGKNTIGGAINVISTRPGNDLSGMLRGTAGSRGRLDVEGKISIPLVKDVLAIKIAAASKNQDGYVTRPDGIDLGDTNVRVGRVALAWNPSADVKVDLSLDGTRIRQNGSPQRLSNTFSAPGGLYDLYNMLAAPYIVARDGLPTGAIFDNTWVSSNLRRSNGTGPTGDDADVWGTNLSIAWKASDLLTIKSITGYREMDAKIRVDMDQSPFPIVHTDEVQSESQLSQEFQFSGRSAESKLDWLVGLYYFRERAHDRNQTLLASGIYDALNLLPAALVPLIPGLTCPPASPALPCAGGAGNPFNALLDLDVRPTTALTTNNFSIFGQASYEVVPKLKLTLGGRYNWEKKSYFIDSIFPNSGRVATPPTTDRRTWKNFTPRLGVDYQANKDILLYASYSKGFKSGGWNPRPLAPEEFKSYNPEKLDAYEVGIKTRWLGGRAILNIAGFHSKYKDLQLQTNSISPTTGGLILTVDNAGAVSIYGFEAEMQARLFAGFTLNGSVGYLHNKYTRLAASTGYSIDAKLPKAPAWTTSVGAQYTVDLPDSLGSLTARGDLNYRSKTYHDPRNTASIVQPGYTLIDGRIAWNSANDRLEFAVFGKNIANKHYFTAAEWVPAFGVQNMVVGRPREWGASATVRF